MNASGSGSVREREVRRKAPSVSETGRGRCTPALSPMHPPPLVEEIQDRPLLWVHKPPMIPGGLTNACRRAGPLGPWPSGA
jgi:hypothetical protein